MPSDSVEEIKNRLNVKDVIQEYVRLEKNGSNHRALCPFHKEKTPSFFVSSTRQIWHCFGCGEGGDIFTFVQKMEGADFPEALRILAKKAGVEIKRQDPRIRSEKNKSSQICELAAKYFQRQLESKNGQIILQYLKGRGISEKSIEEFKIGYAPFNSESLIQFLNKGGYSFLEIEKAGIAYHRRERNVYVSRYAGRIIFPIFNLEGSAVAFGARKLTKEICEKIGKEYQENIAKYINTPQTNIYDKSRILYGLDKAKIGIRQEDTCIVMEGYTDVVLAHQYGYKNVVSASGTALTEDQLRIINRFTDNILTAFDKDTAGDNATRRGLGLAQNMGFNVKIIPMKEGYDPADVIKEDSKKWDKAVKNAQSVIEFYFARAFSLHDSSSPEGKREIGKILAPILKSIASRIEQAHWVEKLATMLGVSQEDVWEEVKKIPQEIQHEDLKDSNSSKKHTTRKELLSRNILLHSLKNPIFIKKAKQELATYYAKGTDLLQMLDKLGGGKEIKDIQKELKKLDKEERELANQILFEGEVTMLDDNLTEEGFNELVQNYKKISLEEDIHELQNIMIENEKLGKHKKNEALLREAQEKLKEKYAI